MTGRRRGASRASAAVAPGGARSPVLVSLGALLLLLGSSGPAHAAAYRYWSFWERDGSTWAYATQGPSTARPVDGEVQGFRFAVSRDSSDAVRPRGAADFASICGDTAARAEQKRVALVIDFGTAADAPEGETPPKARTACARVPDDATTAEALASVAKPLRYDTDALLCAIEGYPVRGCGETVDSDTGADTDTGTHTDSGAESEEGEGPSVGLFVGVGAVAVLGGAAVWRARRRRG